MGKKTKSDQTGPPLLNVDFMKKVVGAPALKQVKEFPDGILRGYILTRHLDAITKAYKREASKFVCDYNIEEFYCGDSKYSYIEITP